MVNDNLDNPTKAISDSTVGSITCLVFLEVSRAIGRGTNQGDGRTDKIQCLHGSSETAAIHFKGLEQIVRMRGDLHSGTMNDLLQRAVLLFVLEADPVLPSADAIPDLTF